MCNELLYQQEMKKLQLQENIRMRREENVRLKKERAEEKKKYGAILMSLKLASLENQERKCCAHNGVHTKWCAGTDSSIVLSEEDQRRIDEMVQDDRLEKIRKLGIGLCEKQDCREMGPRNCS